MKLIGIGKSAGMFAGVAALAMLAGCRVQVDKGANGEDKTVQVDTPFGGVHVNTNQTTAADLGLPAYPGATPVVDKENDKSADVHMGFGEWELRVKVVTYTTPDSKDKVVAFYKQALSQYGEVISCQDHVAVGTPTTTSQGLSCSDGPRTKVNIDDESFGSGSGHSGFELRAGSKRHQHIVGFQKSAPGQTQFALVALDLPAGTDTSDGKSD